MRIVTQADVRKAFLALQRTRSARRAASLTAAIAEAKTRAIPCDGAAHSNAFIDNCAICMPWWGLCLPARDESVRTFGIDGLDWLVGESRGTYLVTQGDDVWHMEAPKHEGALPAITRQPAETDDWAHRCAQEAVLRFIAEG